MRTTKTIEIECENCDTCGAELFSYDDRGRVPSHMYGVFFNPGTDTYHCERTCIPD